MSIRQVDKNRHVLTVEQWMVFTMEILGKPPELRKRAMDRLVLAESTARLTDPPAFTADEEKRAVRLHRGEPQREEVGKRDVVGSCQRVTSRDPTQSCGT